MSLQLSQPPPVVLTSLPQDASTNASAGAHDSRGTNRTINSFGGHLVADVVCKMPKNLPARILSILDVISHDLGMQGTLLFTVNTGVARIWSAGERPEIR